MKKDGKAKAKKPVRYDAPEVLAKFDAESFALIVAKRNEVQQLKAAAVVAKEKAADCKKKWELSRNELEDLTGVREKYRGQKPAGVQLTLDDIKPDGSYAVGPGETPADQVKPAATEFKPDAPHAELWRQFPLEKWMSYGYGATESDIKKLAEGKIKGKPGKGFPIRTVGDLSDFTQPWEGDPSRNYGYADIVGLGEAGAARISDAQIRFFNEWNTKGLAAEFAREKGVSINANNEADAKGSGGTDGEGGKGNVAGKPGSAGSGNGKSGQRRKPHAANPGSKAAKKRERKPIRHTPTTTPKINNRGDDAGSPFAPDTIPYAGKGEGKAEGGEGLDPAEATTSATA